MHPFMLQALNVLLFASVVVMLLSLALRTIYCAWRGIAPRHNFQKYFRKKPALLLAWFILLGGTACILYGFLIEPTWLNVTTYTITSPKIPTGKRIRIVHIADLHVREQGPREKALPDLVAELAPDLILHTGDFFGGHPDEGQIVTGLIESWDQPQYTCMGNWDGRRVFENSVKMKKIIILDRRSFSIEVNGIPCTLSGFSSGKEIIMKPLLSELSDESLNIVLYHHPQGFPELFHTPADLMLAGHTHGGQIRLPFYGALITMDRLGKRYESGHYEEHRKHLVVSRGLGCEPGIPEVRFLCRPEVVVIDMVGEQAETN